MATLPQLLEEDIQQLDDALRELLEQSNATAALITDEAGFLITHQGDARQFDLTTIAALASGTYMATQAIANLINETSFNSVYQQGENFSMFAMNVDGNCLLVVIFKAQFGVGVVKYFAATTVEKAARQLKIAHERNPDAGLDLSVINVADTASFFRKKEE